MFLRVVWGVKPTSKLWTQGTVSQFHYRPRSSGLSEPTQTKANTAQCLPITGEIVIACAKTIDMTPLATELTDVLN